MRKLYIGFVGLGVVGGAVAEAFSEIFPIVGYDIKTAPLAKDELLLTDMIFLSLPTATVNGEQDQSALEETCAWLKEKKYKGPVVVKSTVLPGTCDRLKQTYGLRIVHNPEFLTAKSPIEDFISQPAVLLSGTYEDVDLVGNAYQLLLPLSRLVYAQDYRTTELAKYTHNLFLATKVGFLNEISRICEALGTSYSGVIAAALTQGKIGETHTRVPNYEKESGKAVFGFGGMCFPKDIQALVTWAKSMGIDLTQIEATNEANLKIRPDTRC